jgi:hypothetical protein
VLVQALVRVLGRVLALVRVPAREQVRVLAREQVRVLVPVRVWVLAWRQAQKLQLFL